MSGQVNKLTWTRWTSVALLVMNSSALPNWAFLDQGDGAPRRRSRPLRHALRACGVGAGPSGRADRAAERIVPNRSRLQLHGQVDRHRSKRTRIYRPSRR
jgi:hypothetical protein